MAMIKVFSADGVKELKCFDTLDDVPFLVEDDLVDESEDEDIVDF